MKSLSRVRLLVTPWTVAHQAPPSMGFSRQEYWSGVPLLSPEAITTSAHKMLSWVAASRRVVPSLPASLLPVSLCLLFFHLLWKVRRAVGWQILCLYSRETWAMYLTNISLLPQWEQSYYIPKSEGNKFRKSLGNNHVSSPSHPPLLVISLLTNSLLLGGE